MIPLLLFACLQDPLRTALGDLDSDSIETHEAADEMLGLLRGLNRANFGEEQAARPFEFAVSAESPTQSDARLKIGFMTAFADLGDARAVPETLPALFHACPEARWHAARCLGRLGDPRAAGELVEAIDDIAVPHGWLAMPERTSVRAEILAALRKITGEKPTGDEVQFWKRWRKRESE